jgi:hypothetical protein
MLEWRDEYARKSGVGPDKVAQSRGEQNREEQRESRNGGPPSEGPQEEEAALTPPPDFEVTAEMRQWAADNHPSVNIERETEKFRNRDFKRQPSDWKSEWKNWIIRAVEYQERNSGSSGQSGREEQLLKLAQDLRWDQKDGESREDYLARIVDWNQRRIEGLGRQH